MAKKKVGNSGFNQIYVIGGVLLVLVAVFAFIAGQATVSDGGDSAGQAINVKNGNVVNNEPQVNFNTGVNIRGDNDAIRFRKWDKVNGHEDLAVITRDGDLGIEGGICNLNGNCTDLNYFLSIDEMGKIKHGNYYANALKMVDSSAHMTLRPYEISVQSANPNGGSLELSNSEMRLINGNLGESLIAPGVIQLKPGVGPIINEIIINGRTGDISASGEICDGEGNCLHNSQDFNSLERVVANVVETWGSGRSYVNSYAKCPSGKNLVIGGCSSSSHGNLATMISSSAPHLNGWSCQTQVVKSVNQSEDDYPGMEFSSSAVALCQ